MDISSSTLGKALIVLGIVLMALGVAFGAVSTVYANRITSNTAIGSVPVGNLTPEEAALRIQERLDNLALDGIPVQLGDQTEVIQPDSIGLDVNIQAAVDAALERGHVGPWYRQAYERIGALWSSRTVPTSAVLDEALLGDRIDDFDRLSAVARRDLRLRITGTDVAVLTDTMPGKVVDRDLTAQRLTDHVLALRTDAVAVPLLDDVPRATLESARQAQAQVERMIARPLYLRYEEHRFSLTGAELGEWVTNEYDGDRLVPGLDVKAISRYVTGIADQLNVPAEPALVTTEDGQITGFTPPRYGRAVQEDETVGRITEQLTLRGTGEETGDVITVPMRQSKPPAISLGEDSGITELIGAATTPFTGSPRNRVSNIKNGVRFLSGITIEPGEEFSTLGTLGTIDNTTGYLPELVIKGDRTVPEYGGGLCQVSTTLFRAALDAGLPITARRNHSFRVGYYEKDAQGNYIGPGLDATIYEPNLDLRFRNDTGNPVLIVGYVQGTLVTFELYGTHDGRSSDIDGPYTLTTVPAGDPVYIETDEIPVGETKQVEWPHPGGSAVATYTITYPDGTEVPQEFKSWYRRWPAKYLVGVDALPTPFPVSPPLPGEE